MFLRARRESAARTVLLLVLAVLSAGTVLVASLSDKDGLCRRGPIRPIEIAPASASLPPEIEALLEQFVPALGERAAGRWANRANDIRAGRVRVVFGVTGLGVPTWRTCTSTGEMWGCRRGT